jgi:hypothetical protein
MGGNISLAGLFRKHKMGCVSLVGFLLGVFKRIGLGIFYGATSNVCQRNEGPFLCFLNRWPENILGGNGEGFQLVSCFSTSLRVLFFSL